MANTINTNIQREDHSNLGFLGTDFQYKLISLFFEDKSFFKSCIGIMNPNMFTEPRLRAIVDRMCKYKEKYNAVPSIDDVVIDINSNVITNEKDKVAFLNDIQKIKEIGPSNSVGFIKEEAHKFFTQQEYIRVYNEMGKIISSGQFEQYSSFKGMFEDAIKKTTIEEEIGEDPFDDIDAILNGTIRHTIPTGIRKLDEVLNGGLGKKELGQICGSSGFGKTSITTAMASYAASYKCAGNNYQGYKVLQIFFEDSYPQIKSKHMARQLSVEACELNKLKYAFPNIKNDILNMEKVGMLKKNLKLLKLHSGEYSASRLEDMIQTKFIDNGINYDLIIIDYFECLAPEKGASSKETHEKEGITMRKLETMPEKLNCAIWIATQGTKDASKNAVITADKFAGSSEKYNIAHINISISRSQEDFENNRANIAILKNRAGKCMVIKNVFFDNGTCRMSSDGESQVMSFEEFYQDEQDRKNSLLRVSIPQSEPDDLGEMPDVQEPEPMGQIQFNSQNDFF